MDRQRMMMEFELARNAALLELKQNQKFATQFVILSETERKVYEPRLLMNSEDGKDTAAFWVRRHVRRINADVVIHVSDTFTTMPVSNEAFDQIVREHITVEDAKRRGLMERREGLMVKLETRDGFQILDVTMYDRRDDHGKTKIKFLNHHHHEFKEGDEGMHSDGRFCDFFSRTDGVERGEKKQETREAQQSNHHPVVDGNNPESAQKEDSQGAELKETRQAKAQDS